MNNVTDAHAGCLDERVLEEQVLEEQVLEDLMKPCNLY